MPTHAFDALILAAGVIAAALVVRIAFDLLESFRAIEQRGEPTQPAAEVVPFPKETRRLTGLGEVLTDEQHAEITRLVRKGGRR